MYSKVQFFALTLLLTIQIAVGQVSVQCRNTPIVPAQDFDLRQYSGKEWYNILYVAGGAVGPAPSKCESESFASTAIPNSYRVNADAVNKADNSNISVSLIVSVDSNNTAVMHVENWEEDTTSVILGTDYDNWSLWYGCAANGGETREWTVIRSRRRTIDQSVYNVLKSWVVSLGFSLENSQEENHAGC